MTGLIDAVLLGSALSVLGGFILLCVVSLRVSRQPEQGVWAWKIARWITVLQVLLASAIYFVPQKSAVLAEGVEPLRNAPPVHLELPVTADIATPQTVPVFEVWSWVGTALVLG